jgi:hypothetical protein
MRTIVNCHTQDDRYKRCYQRLNKSFKTQNSGTISLVTFFGESSCGAPLHKDNPYAFKLYSMISLSSDEQRSVLWLDASVVLVRDASEVFEIIERDGVFFEKSGHSVGQWCNDETLQNFGITREEAYAMPMFSSGFMGISFEHEIGREFFKRWWESMERGDFKGSWSNHRHDQTSGSIIANQMGLAKNMMREHHFFPYVGDNYAEPKETAIGHLVGC